MKKDIKVFGFEKGIDLISGEKLESFQLKVETYGELNSTKSNAVLVCHAFSGSHHVAGNDDELGVGWWDQFVGPGKPIDTNIYFVVCCNNLGGCFGSTGPSSLNPKTQKVYGSTFPNVGVTDWVRSQKMLMDKMKIPYWHLVIGGSLGGMQALEWAIQFPKFIKKAGIIAAAANSSPQNIAMNEVARESIKKDPNYCDGNYAEHGVFPKNGIKTARMLGHITYLSEEHMNQRFGRKFQDDDTKVFEDVNFEVENYLQYKGEKFSSLFDANSYILMTKAMDDYDAGKKRELSSILKNVEAELLIIGFYSDWLYPPEKGKAIQIAAMNNNIKSSYIVLDGEHGHDSFLFATDKYSRIIKNFIKS
tara:strand:- start:1212 stop:2297 length:1086 start_codon:yes stop_codon:yes gene_type:complete